MSNKVQSFVTLCSEHFKHYSRERGCDEASSFAPSVCALRDVNETLMAFSSRFLHSHAAYTDVGDL